MSAEREKFLQQIRTDSNYPFTRNFLKVFYIAACTVASLVAVVTFVSWGIFLKDSGLFSDSSDRSLAFVFGEILFISFFVVIIMFLKFYYQFTILCIDIADSILQSAYDLKSVVINSKSCSYVLTKKLLPDIDLASKRSKDA